MKMLDIDTFASANVMRNTLAAKAAERLGRNVDPDTIGMWGRVSKSTVIEENKGYEIEGLCTTDDVDCDEEVVLPGGIDWSIFQSYKSVYSDHWYGLKNIVGTMRYVKRIGDRGWMLRTRMLPFDTSEDARKIVALANEGAMGYSIGFVTTDRGAPTAEEKKRYPMAQSIVRACRVFEVSFTAMPCNLIARCDTVAVDDSKSARVLEMVTKGILPREYGRAYIHEKKSVTVMAPKRIIVF